MAVDAMRSALENGVPMNKHLGLTVVEMEPGRGVVLLPDAPELKNHVGSQHAAALFGAGEAASGAAVVAAFADLLATATPLAKSADIRYLRIARGPITATGTLGRDATELRATLETDGRVAFPVEVALTDGAGEIVATMTVQWHIAKRG